jgi:hypothetical protein
MTARKKLEEADFFIQKLLQKLASKCDTLGVVRNLFGEIVEQIHVPTDGVIHTISLGLRGRCPPPNWQGHLRNEVTLFPQGR